MEESAESANIKYLIYVIMKLYLGNNNSDKMGILGSVIRQIFTIISYGYAMWALPLAATAFLVNLRLWFEHWLILR